MQIKTISPRQLAELHRSGSTIDLIDVRTPAEYRAMHLDGARNVPLDRLDPVSEMRQRRGTIHQPLYVICQSGKRGERACNQFIAAGFENVVNVHGGTQACEQAGLPILVGKGAISLERQVRIAAGALVLIGIALGLTVHLVFLGLSAFVGAGLVFAGVTDTCGMALVLARMPWNRPRDGQDGCSVSAAGGV